MPVGRPYASWMATLKNDLSLHNLTLEDAIELALNKPLCRLLAASRSYVLWCMPNNNDDSDVIYKVLIKSTDVSLSICLCRWCCEATENSAGGLGISRINYRD